MEENVKEKKDYIQIKKSTLIAGSVIVLLIYLITSTVLVTSTFKKQQKLLDELTEKVDDVVKEVASFESYILGTDTNYESDQVLDISNMDYYAQYELDDSKLANLQNSNSEYLLYLFQDNCTFCEHANIYVNAYMNDLIAEKYKGLVNLYFIKAGNVSEENWNKYMSIEGTDEMRGTPTLAHVKTDGTIEFFEGHNDSMVDDSNVSDGIFGCLNQIVLNSEKN